MSDASADFPAPLRTFVELFNAGRFWEAHEVLEAPWREHGSAFYKGLILYASAFVHLQNANAHGVRAQLAKAEAQLRAFTPAYLGVDVEAVLTHAGATRAEAGAAAEGAAHPGGERWHERMVVPPLRLEARWLRGDEPEAG